MSLKEFQNESPGTPVFNDQASDWGLHASTMVSGHAFGWGPFFFAAVVQEGLWLGPVFLSCWFLGKKPSLKVHINSTSDSILLKFLRPNPNVKLEGFLLGYGSNTSPNQYFPLPTEGKYTEAVVVIQNVTHKASIKSPDKIPFGGTILVHLIIPGLNESTVKLPSSIMLEISDALKAQLANNETLALPAESKTPEMEKITAQHITAPEPLTLPPPQSTKAPPKTKRPGRRPRPKPTRSPEVPKSKPAPKITQRARTRRPRPKHKSTLNPKIPQTKPVLYQDLCLFFYCTSANLWIVKHLFPNINILPVWYSVEYFSDNYFKQAILLCFSSEKIDQSTQELFTTKIPRTTELAKTTPGAKQAPKPSGSGRNVSVDSTQSTRKPATVPRTHRLPLPPRPVPPRRKPLPPNNVTGKPGSSRIISSLVTSPPPRATLKPTETTTERQETDRKQPTAPASGEELGNTTDFSSSPTRETDHLGKPRFKGPHVRYIPKPDNRPCSITDSIKRFPTEEAMEGNATSPPQNPPTNLTVVTVEGCPSFVILDWEKPLNDTVTEYEVISRENGSFSGKNKSIQITNQTFSTVENLKPDTSYEFQVKPKNPLGEGPASNTVAFSTESADPRVSEPVSGGRDAIWTERPFNSDSYSECKGKQYVKRTWYKKFVGVQLCNSLRYKIYLSDSLTGKFYNIGDQRGHGEDHCQFVDSFLDGRTGQHLFSDQLPTKEGYFRAVRQEPVQFGEIGGHTQINYVQWYECGTTIPGKW
ncbi:Target of Nesh-SH3 [Fukomys damarensis]|uniref:Target of Nesh-SH3 n=1 Tax=Fukomys damarensis TaxID=885580 RepID=A0A091D8S7_FUKDA|nr:Target of Nesh-SH3 [Fukomys damarensis]